MNRYVWILIYLGCMALVVFGMHRGRASAIASYGTADAQSSWDQWRAVAEQESDRDGPVQRRTRESDAPPALVLMRDYFYQCLGFALLMTTVLFGTLALMVQGALARPDDDSPANALE